MQPVSYSTLRSYVAPQFNETIDKIKELAHFSLFSDEKLKRDLSEISVQNLNAILNCVLSEVMQENLDPITIFEKLSPYLSLETIEELGKSHKQNFKGALVEAQNKFKEAKLYLEAKSFLSPSISSYFHNILDKIVNLIESILNVFGINHVLKPAEGEIHASFKAQQLMMLLQLMMMLCTILLPSLGYDTGGIIIGGVFAAIIGLSVLFPYIRPMPSHLPANAEPVTKEIREGKRGYRAKKASLDSMADILDRNQHVLLVGKSRVGKSLTAKAFAEAIERGDYPQFKDYAVFRINTADIVGHGPSFMGGGNDTLFKIHEAMGRHAGKIILVFDEIHMACKDKTIADQFKPFLDEGGKFSHVIGITTDTEYNYVKQNEAFGNRFDRVDITNTDENDTLDILSETILRHPARPLIEPEALKQILDVKKEAPQPITALKLLKKCIQATQAKEISPLQQSIVTLRDKINSIQLRSAAFRGHVESEDTTELENTLHEKQRLAEVENENLKRLWQTKRMYDRVTEICYKAILNEDLNKFILMRQILDPFLWAYIKHLSETLKVRAIVDSGLVNICAKEVSA